MTRKVIVIPAKRDSRRVPDKNWRVFSHGLSLTEWKIRAALATDADQIVVSTDNFDCSERLRDSRVHVQARSRALCGDHVDLRQLFAEVLENFANDVVFWAHPTSPFVKSKTIAMAMDAAARSSGKCILGVEVRREFLWKETGPLNYDPTAQPRSQDLPPLFVVTGGVHCAFGRDFIRTGSVSFTPAEFVRLTLPESMDIDDMDDWRLAQMLAESTPLNPGEE